MTQTTDFPDLDGLAELVALCADRQRAELPPDAKRMLVDWHRGVFTERSEFLQELLSSPTETWDRAIGAHRAHAHDWYLFVRDVIDVDNMASFLLENSHYPTFMVLLEKIRDVQFTDDAVAAVQENIDDEYQPEPHANLMARLMMAVKARASDPLVLDVYPEVIDRTLIFYYGHFTSPWHLVGSLFATEQMGTHRVVCMRDGLQRMGLTAHELEFTTVHADCDEQHADDWLQRVIIPSVETRPELRPIIAEGIAQCLDTSAVYLDYLLRRAGQRQLSEGFDLAAP